MHDIQINDLNRVLVTARKKACHPMSKKNMSPMSRIDKLSILALFCESDAGLDETESFAKFMSDNCTSLSHNSYNPSRRHKNLMNEALELAGIPTVKQQLCESIQQAKQFCIDEEWACL